MKKEVSLRKKMSFYSLLAGSFVGTAISSKAQVAYHDVNPDSVLTDPLDTMLIDVNNDGIFDFKLAAVSANFASIPFEERLAAAVPLAYSGFENALAGTTQHYHTFGGATGPFLFPFAFNAGEIIDQNAPWFSLNQLYFMDSQGGTHLFWPGMASVVIAGTTNYHGHWLDGEDHYLPLKISDGANANYGWARCRISQDILSLTVESWAIQMTSNTPILAGEGDPSGVEGISTSGEVQIIAFEKNIYITLPPNYKRSTVRIENMFGENMKSIVTEQKQIHLNLDNLANGLYIVTVQNDSILNSKKVFLR